MKNYLLVNEENEYFTGKTYTKKGQVFAYVTCEIIKAKFYSREQYAINAVKRINSKVDMTFRIKKIETNVVCD